MFIDSLCRLSLVNSSKILGQFFSCILIAFVLQFGSFEPEAILLHALILQDIQQHSVQGSYFQSISICAFYFLWKPLFSPSGIFQEVVPYQDYKSFSDGMVTISPPAISCASLPISYGNLVTLCLQTLASISSF